MSKKIVRPQVPAPIETGHTPGPWRAIKNTGVITSNACQIGRVGDFSDHELRRFNRERWEADARLIAAAPDLLAAAETVLAGLLNRFEAAPGNAKPVFSGIAALHIAINKAKS